MGHAKVSCISSIAAASLVGMIVAGPVLADSRVDVLERIKPVGQVAIEGQPSPVTPAAAVPAAKAKAAAVPVAKSKPAPAAPAPVKVAAKPAPAAAPAAGGAGATLYASKGCGGCYGPDGKKTILPTYPKVAGLPSAYALNQMKDIKSGARANGQSAAMKGVVMMVSDDDMRAIAEWLSSQ